MRNERRERGVWAKVKACSGGKDRKGGRKDKGIMEVGQGGVV